MLLDYDPRWSDDPRSNDPDHRDLSRGSRAGSDPRGRGQVDPRDVFMEHVDLPCGLDREHVHSHDHDYTLRGSETRTLTTVGAFRVVPANDLRDKFDQSLDPRHGELWHPREAGLVHTVRLGRDTTVVTLTKEGRDLLESRQRDADAANRQAFHHGIQRPRELKHDAQVYRAYLEEAERLREEGAHIHRIVLENELKAEYQEFLQDRIATARTATDGRIAMPTRCVPGPSSTTCRATIRPRAPATAADTRPCHPASEAPRRHRREPGVGVAGGGRGEGRAPHCAYSDQPCGPSSRDHRGRRQTDGPVFPECLPIVIHVEGRGVLVHVVTDPFLDEFRVFLERHAPVLRALRAWTLRIGVPPHLPRVGLRAKRVVWNQLLTPLRGEVIDELRWYFDQVRIHPTPSRCQ